MVVMVEMVGMVGRELERQEGQQGQRGQPALQRLVILYRLGLQGKLVEQVGLAILTLQV
jgi:hypothetical protein